jgi:hypothetical protein
MRRSPGAAALILASTVAMVGSHLLGVEPLRVATTLWFLAVAPGVAFTPALPHRESVARAAVVVAVSLVIETLITTGLLVAGAYDPKAALFAVTAVALTGCAIAASPRGPVVADTMIRIHD